MRPLVHCHWPSLDSNWMTDDELEERAQLLLERWRKNPSKALAVEDDEILERCHPTRFWAGWDPSLDPLVGYSYVTDPHIPAMPAET